MDLVAGELRLRFLTCDHNGASGSVHLDCMLQGNVGGKHKEFLKHFDYIIVGVLVVIQQHNVIQMSMLFPFGISFSGTGSGDLGSNYRTLHRAGNTLLDHLPAKSCNGEPRELCAASKLLLQ